MMRLQYISENICLITITACIFSLVDVTRSTQTYYLSFNMLNLHAQFNAITAQVDHIRPGYGKEL